MLTTANAHTRQISTPSLPPCINARPTRSSIPSNEANLKPTPLPLQRPAQPSPAQPSPSPHNHPRTSKSHLTPRYASKSTPKRQQPPPQGRPLGVRTDWRPWAGTACRRARLWARTASGQLSCHPGTEIMTAGGALLLGDAIQHGRDVQSAAEPGRLVYSSRVRTSTSTAATTGAASHEEEEEEEEEEVVQASRRRGARGLGCSGPAAGGRLARPAQGFVDIPVRPRRNATQRNAGLELEQPRGASPALRREGATSCQSRSGGIPVYRQSLVPHAPAHRWPQDCDARAAAADSDGWAAGAAGAEAEAEAEAGFPRAGRRPEAGHAPPPLPRLQLASLMHLTARLDSNALILASYNRRTSLDHLSLPHHLTKPLQRNTTELSDLPTLTESRALDTRTFYPAVS
ncbi:hypothetical protein JHW43_000074 [Diplocarpon mali]|nr:hypothetical protein JHW43_000074 [Diplocarpon mali]